MDVIKRYKEIKEQVEQKKSLIDKYNQEIAELKLELADLILLNDTELIGVEHNLTTIISVKFLNKENVYDYIWDEITPVAVGDMVCVPDKWRTGQFKEVKVVSVRYENIDNSNGFYKCARTLASDELE